ncbi:hypothetical protein AB0F85_25175 [Nocardia fluminea]|uniref:hypothetical protein n=1 Tax=Nocardia fluminea TaxID=134984 RepID=UPI0033E424F1
MPIFPPATAPEVAELLTALNEELLLSIAAIRMAPRGGWSFRDAVEEMTRSSHPAMAQRQRPDGTFEEEPFDLIVPPPTRFDVCDPYGFRIDTPSSATTIAADKFLAAFDGNSPQAEAVSRMWSAWFYALWDEDYRHRLAGLHECEPRDIQHEYFADLRKLRHDTAHGKGLARKKGAARCTVLTPFREGRPIVLRFSHFREIVEKFPWDYLATKPGPAPARMDSLTVSVEDALVERFRRAATADGKTVHAATEEAITMWLAGRAGLAGT